MEEIEISARGMRFAGLADGQEDRPLVLLLHGLPRNSWEWHHQIPPIAAMGFRVIAHDLRGFCDGARPEGVESYHLDEFVADTLAIADELGGAGTPFHLMGTSIGSSIAWGLAAKHPERVWSLAGINIPHPSAIREAMTASQATAADQGERFSYFREAAKEGNERAMFERMLEVQGVSRVESEPYRRALDSEEALRAIFHWYRALPLWSRDEFPPVAAPTTFIWPPGSDNVSRASVDAIANWVTGPYRLEVVEDAHQPILQAEPAKLTELLLAHLARLSGVGT
ncbi:MAG: alpha/beta hydrolase [Actinomycetia bacterium]|nr:alpha/beta hydrolase [Actinomycetes bacterium]MCP4961644.1 alpha/beta hydrolase [Actinomycetes bacterium]